MAGDASAASGANVTEDGVSRRGFMQRGAVAIGAFVALDAIGGLTIAAGREPAPTPLAQGVIFPDPTLCIGCLTCEVACSRAHREVGLSTVPRIRIFQDAAVKVDPLVLDAYPNRGSFHQEVCLQCPTAECLYVCPVDATAVEAKTGARYVKQDACVSCGRCAEACPFPISDLSESTATNQLKLGQVTRITYDPETDAYTKCDLCYFRAEGPACVDACPINVRINQGVLKVDKGRMCLEAPMADKPTWDTLRQSQTFQNSPARGKV